jgi:F-box protein 21
MVRSLIHLPDEILNSILCLSSPQTCAAVEQTHPRFRNVTNEPLLWRYYCQSHYKYWDRRHEIRQKLTRPVKTIEWKTLFVSRYLVDRSVTQLLDSILDSQTGRIKKFCSMIDLGYDAKDTLLRHSRVNSGEDILARRWARCLCKIDMCSA